MANEQRGFTRPTLSRRYLRHGMLPQLAAFEAVVRLGSATQAAEALCMAQPTLSGHLRKLGEALGVRLFERDGKRLVPTEAAWDLLDTTREVMAAFERCEQHLAAYRPQDAALSLRRSIPQAATGLPIDAHQRHGASNVAMAARAGGWHASQLQAPDA